MLGAPEISNDSTASASSMNGIEHSDENDAVDGRAQGNLYISADHSNVSVKLEDEIDGVLQELKLSQESEYWLAEQKLYAQKDFLLSLYQQLESERSELASPMPLPAGSGVSDDLLADVLNRVDQIKHEEAKLKEMMKIARGFGESPRTVLNIHFGLPIKD